MSYEDDKKWEKMRLGGSKESIDPNFRQNLMKLQKQMERKAKLQELKKEVDAGGNATDAKKAEKMPQGTGGMKQESVVTAKGKVDHKKLQQQEKMEKAREKQQGTTEKTQNMS